MRALALALMLLVAACGVRNDPVPPSEAQEQRS